MSGAARSRRSSDYTRFPDADAPKGARIGVVRAGGFHPTVWPVLEALIAAINSAGATVVDPVEVSTFGKFGGAVCRVLTYEFKATLDAYLRAADPGAKACNPARSQP